MFGLILSSVLLTGSLNPEHPTEIIKKESGDGYTFFKLFFSGHSYVYFRYHLNSAGNAFIHDPDCNCIQRGLELMLKEKK